MTTPAGERRSTIVAPLIIGQVLLLGLMGWFAAHAESVTPWFLTPLTAALAGALGAVLALPRSSGASGERKKPPASAMLLVPAPRRPRRK